VFEPRFNSSLDNTYQSWQKKKLAKEIGKLVIAKRLSDYCFGLFIVFRINKTIIKAKMPPVIASPINE
jgi:hypothetical protein